MGLLMVKVLDEVARSGGFTWIDSFVYEQALPADKYLLVWSIATYDISVNWWFTTPEHVALGYVDFQKLFCFTDLCQFFFIMTNELYFMNIFNLFICFIY